MLLGHLSSNAGVFITDEEFYSAPDFVHY